MEEATACPSCSVTPQPSTLRGYASQIRHPHWHLREVPDGIALLMRQSIRDNNRHQHEVIVAQRMNRWRNESVGLQSRFNLFRCAIEIASEFDFLITQSSDFGERTFHDTHENDYAQIGIVPAINQQRLQR